jgi:hypothetical protein
LQRSLVSLSASTTNHLKQILALLKPHILLYDSQCTDFYHHGTFPSPTGVGSSQPKLFPREFQLPRAGSQLDALSANRFSCSAIQNKPVTGVPPLPRPINLLTVALVRATCHCAPGQAESSQPLHYRVAVDSSLLTQVIHVSHSLCVFGCVLSDGCRFNGKKPFVRPPLATPHSRILMREIPARHRNICLLLSDHRVATASKYPNVNLSVLLRICDP